jgi:DivIVA domain-containing protein
MIRPREPDRASAGETRWWRCPDAQPTVGRHARAMRPDATPCTARMWGVLAALGSARSPACRAPKQPPPGRGLVRPDAKLCGMSVRGQSLSMFVVQRSFSRVRRGYDPDEVDRHLELVSRWFTSTDAARHSRMNARSCKDVSAP